MKQAFFEMETNAFGHGRTIKNPRVLYTVFDKNGEEYPLKYGDIQSPTADHVNWLHMQVTGQSLSEQYKPTAHEIKIIIEFYDHEARYTKLIFTGKPGSWNLVKREAGE